MQALSEDLALSVDVGEQGRVADLAQGGARHRAGQRVAAEGRAVGPQRERRGDLLAGQHGPDGYAASERFGYRHHVGCHVVPLVGEQPTGASHPALDLVEHQQRLVPVAQAPQVGQEARRRGGDAAFPLHRLDEHGACLRRDQLLDGVEVVERAVAEAGRQRLEALVVLGLGGGRHGGQGASVERTLEADDLPFVGRMTQARVLAHQLDRRLIGLGARVAEEHPVGEAGRHQLLRQQHRWFGEVDVARMPQPFALRSEGRQQGRMPMAK